VEILKARRAWSQVFQALNENNFKPRILYPAKLSFKIDRSIKIFPDKHKQKQYMTTKPPIQNILQGILNKENQSKQNHEKTGSIKLQEKKRRNQKKNIDSAAHIQTLKQQKLNLPSGRPLKIGRSNNAYLSQSRLQTYIDQTR
jgi:Holliday junction resolvase RusA-like endonuclease